jgi:hypothetical protein
VIATFAAVLAICGASLALGQAAIALCGAGRWSWLSPAVGLALLCSICWATVRLPGDGIVSAIAVLILTIASILFLRGRVEGEAIRVGLPVAALALLAASLPFAAEGHFGILGTGFDPDMSQHLLATDRLIHGAGSPLLHQGYPLGPHAAVAALNRGLGIGIVQGFDGLTIAAAILASLTALAAFLDQPPLRRIVAASLVGLPYLVASYYAQGAFKETIQALLVLAFVLALRESGRAWRDLPLRFVPAAILAIGSVYVYSFPGLIWLAAIALVWGALEWVGGKDASPGGGVGWGVSSASPEAAEGEAASLWVQDPCARSSAQGQEDTPHPPTGPAGRYALSLALIVFLVGALPELGRMIDFHSFETFNPSGPGLGNLFGQISPFEALGIWPSGDFRLAPGDGAVPAAVYYLVAAFATTLLLYNLIRCWRARERAILAGALTVAALYAAARLGGTPYTAAKALEIAAPILALVILTLLRNEDGDRRLSRPMVKKSAYRGRGGHGARLAALAALLYMLTAAGCSLLAFANAPVGPTSYSPALTGLRPLLGAGPTLVLAPDSLLTDEHGARYIAWELRGGRVCIEPASSSGGAPPVGIRFVITSDPASRPPFHGLKLLDRAVPYLVWERRGVLGGPSPCPLIAVRQARAAKD